MPPLCTYYGPELAPAELEATILDGGLADLSRPGDPVPVVAGVRLVGTPEIGCAVPYPETDPETPGGSDGEESGEESPSGKAAKKRK